MRIAIFDLRCGSRIRYEIRLLVREKREKSMVYSFIFRKLNEEPQREVARGTLAVACVTRDNSTGQMTGVPIPKAIADKIEVAPPEILDCMTPSARCSLDRFAIEAIQLEKLQLLLTTVLSRQPFLLSQVAARGSERRHCIPRRVCCSRAVHG